MDIDLERSEAFSVSFISSTQKPTPPPWNTTATLEDLALDSNFAWLLCALFFAISWVVYITYYNSRIIGFIITKILNRIYPNGCIKIGSFCISVLSGKIMFRDVAFINEDFTIRAQDGWLIFCWWKPYFKKDVADDLSHCETRLSVLLNGLELHVYNRSQLYSRLEKLFGLESKLIKTAATNCVAKSSSKVPSSGNTENGTDAGDILESQQNDDISHFDWKDLVPVVKLEISMGRLVFGNRLLPTTLSVSFEEAIIVYTSKPASSRLDLFTHICKCTGENFKVLLAPSPKYTGMTDEPPRYMGEGFVVLQSNFVDLYYYQDEPGKVVATLETVRMANGDIVQKTTHPLWGLDIKCGKGTDFSYGPWADRQREQLFKFFFPQEYQTLKPTEELKLGELRRPQTFDLRLNTLADATVDILFSKEKETNAIHMNVGPGSYLEATVPWLVKENGYKSRVCGQLLHLDASTSLQYRSLVESETLQFDVEVHYPLHWSDQQDWQCTLTGCKTTVHLIYSHKVFFQALMEDWASKSRPDILRFVPYTWHFSLILKEFELILVTNEHNWIDCSSQLQENAQLAICGELFDLSFDLPFVEFLPPIVSLKFWIQGECVALSAHIPEANPCKTSVLIMEEFAKLCNRDGSLKRSSLDNEKKWRNVTTKSSGWVECWTVPIVALSITYSYYPTPPLGIHGFDMDITTPEKEEILLSPIRPNKSSKKAPMTEEDYNLSGSQTNTPGGEKSGCGGNKSFSQPPPDFDPNLLAPDKIHMELEIGPSVLKLYGALLCYLIQAKDNYLGENQAFTDFSSAISSLGMQNRVADGKKNDSNNPDESSVNGGVENKGVEKHFDPRHYRPLDVIVSVTLHDIHGHIMKACSPNDPPCPFVNLERLCLELHKTFNETRLQLLLSPLIICVENHPTVQPLDEEEIGLLYSIDGKPPDPKVLNNSAHGGHLVLSALQVRAHAMFSNCNRTLNQETLEYAWLVEIQLGDLTGRLTAAQLQNLLLALEMFTFQAEQVDSVLQPTRPYRKCQHDLPQALCPQSNVIINPHTASKNCCSVPGGNSDFFSLCPCPEDVKYRMTRLSLDEFDLCLVDNNTALELETFSIRITPSDWLKLHERLQKTNFKRRDVMVNVSETKFSLFKANVGGGAMTLIQSSSEAQEAGPVRLSTCNLHGQDCCSGFSLVVQKVVLHQYITTHNNSAQINTEATGPDTWLEAGQISLGPITFDGATSHAINDHWIVQDKFLKVHDFKTKRLWFLWPDELNLLPKKLIGECGCIGGCSFYGSDQNQSNFFDISEKPESGQCHFGQSNPVHSTGGKLRVCSEDDSYGFGKSLLYEGEYVFDVQGSTSTQDHVLTHPSLLQGSLTFTEGYLERSASKTPDLSPKHHSESSMGHGNSIDLVDGIFSKPVDSLNRTISTSQKEISLTENSYHGAADRSASSPLVPSVSLMSASTDSGENEVKSEILFLKPSLKGSKPEELSGNVTHWHGGGSRRSLTGLITDSSVTATRGISPRSVRRAISTESTHSSEAYFSADEESSSSVVGDEERTTTAGSVSSSGSYPQEITGNHTYCSETFPTTRVRMGKFGNGSLERKIHPTCNRQSLEDIEEKPSFLRHSLRSNASGSSDSQTSASSSGVGGGPYDHSNVAAESNSVSSSSFISAVSSQEDVALVDLHNQMEKEIVDSPVLMSCYTTHLTHVHCHHWNTPLPLPHLFHNEPPSSSSSRLTSDRKRTSPSKEYLFRKDSSQWKPKFIHINEGFTSIKIIGRSESKTRATRSAETGVTNNSWNRRKQAKEEKDSPNTKDYFIPGSLQQHYKAKREIQDIEEVTSDRTIYRNTIVIKVEGDINATISPLMLDSLKKFLETLVPVQSTTHPLAILNHIHKLCAGHVIWQNQLKKEKVLYLCQLQNQKFNSASSIRNQHQNKLNFKVIGANKDLRDERHSITNDSESVSSTTNYEEIRTEHMQAFLDVAAINISVLQAAIVEEVIAFSALDNVKDLTCASLFAVRLDNIFVEVSKRQHTHRALQTFAQSKGSVKDVKQRSKNDNFGVSSAWKTATRKKGKDDSLPGELVTVELKNEEEAEVAFSTKVGCIHSQLRRLKNSSSILKEAVLTVIPSRRSKVGFTFETPKILPKTPVPSDLKEENDLFPDNFGCSFSDENERFGFIMFECGLEDVTVKFLRNKQKPFAITGPNINKEKDRGSTSNPEAEHVDSANNQADGVESVSGQTSFAQGDGKGQEQDNNYKKQNVQYSQSTLAGDLSSLVVEFKTVWLNFAAPPKTPNTRKIDFTRLDWHLLSTATPSINAWLKSGNRFQEVLVTLIKTSHHRTCAVLGCLMADALDRQDIHMPVKSKFLHSKLTPLAKTLQEDPSCQLLMVLKRYLNTASSYTIEKNIQPELVPPIQSLKRGIVALGRQWKNILYMPLLMEQNYRLRRNVPPYSVSFIAPDNDQGKSSTDDDKVSLDECEVTDETTNLLMAEGGSIFIHPTTGELYSNGVMNGAGGHDNAAALGATKSSSTPDVASAAHAHKDNQKTEDVIGGLKGHTMPSRTKKKLPSYPPRSSRASVAFPLLGGPLDSPARYTNAISKVSGLVLPSRSSHTGFGKEAKVKKNESRPSLQKSTTWSLTSIEPSNLPTSIMETPLRTTAVEDYKHNEDLYNWMARQRDDLESTKDAEFEVQALHRQIEQERLAKMFNTSRVSPEQEEEDDKTSGPLFFGPIPSGLQLADAHEIFAPLFSHLGIEDASFTDSYPFNVSKKFGNKISICCFVEVLKVDIVESEYMQASSGRRKKKRQANGDIAHSTKFVFINTSLDTPAFVCNKFTLDLSLIQKLDVEATKRDTSLIQLQGDNHGTNHHGHHYHRHNFTARTSTSAATHSYLWPGSGSSPSLTTVINFTLNANYIAQQVNMPVLRLLHQFASMYQNVVETKLELKSKRARSFKSNVKDHLKKSPSAGTGSQADSSRPHSPQIPPTSSNGKSIPTGRLSMKSISGGVASLTAGITRTQSLSQKLRTTCNLKGYTNLQEALTSRTERPYSPLSLAISEAVAIDIPDSQNHSGLSGMPETSEVSIDEVDAGTDDEIRKSEEEFAHKDFHPHCWKTMYHLLKLYEFRPETKTVINRIEIKPLDVSENYKGNGKYEQLKDPGSDTVDGLSKPHDSTLKSIHRQPLISLSKGQIREISKSVYVQERVPLIAFGVIKARRVKLLATLSGLKLETELNGLNSSLTVKERTRGPNRRWSESSLTGQLGQSVVSVLEGVPPNQGVVVKMSVGKSQTLYSSLSKSGKVHNSGLLTIGPIEIDIPQHPVALHGMMTRSSRQLSTTLQELRSSRQSSRSSRQMEDLSNFPYYEHLLSPQSHHFVGSHQTGILGSAARARQAQLISPIVIQFSIIVDSLTIGAALLPSLKAQYKMGQVTSMGITGSKAKFTVDLPKHTLSFNTNIPTDANLPSSASVDLPPVHISAEYVQDNSSTSGPNHNTQQPSGLLGGVNGPFGKVDSFTDGVVLRQGNYLSALAEIGSFEHCLTTDLLNHLVLVQKVFMKEVNEVLQKMSGGDKIAPLWNDEKAPAPSNTSIDHQRLLFSVQLRLKGIQITATTPTNSAVRLETGVVELQVSNRVQNMSVGVGTGSNYIKLFGKAQVDINLSLGQLLKNALFEEAEPEFQQFAYFKTRICMRNALQDEMISSQSEDKEAVLITLIRPLIYLQPVALDKAVLVWLNYKNAYEFWNEQRSAVNKEELLVTQQLLEKVPQISQLGAQSLGTLFLQLTVKDMGICLPLSHPSGFAGSKAYDTELKAAVVVTLESTRVSACSCQSLVSKARFTGLCIRFADDFETSLDDWKPDPMDSSIMNLCVVSEGTYEICSQTLAPQPSSIPPANAKWILNVQWQMEGVDIHVDTNIGKQLSALFKTLTALTGEDEGNKGMNFEANFENQTSNERRNAMMKIISSGGGNANSFLDVDCMDGDSSDASEIIKRSRIRDQDVTVYQRKNSLYPENTQGMLIDPSQEAKKRSRLIEKEMNEQAKIINDLRLLGASQSTIEQEMKRLQELEAAVFNDFRRDVIKKLRRQSVKATSFKDKLGLGSRLGGTGNPSMSLFFPDVVHERPENSLTELDYAAGDVLGSFSQDSSPSHDQTRTGSVDISDSNNISPEDKKISQREPSLDSVFAHPGAGGEAYSESSTPSHGLDGCSPSTLIAKLPESQNEHVPTSPSTLSSSENDQDYPPVVLRSRGYRGTQSSSDHNRSLLDNDVKSGSTNSKPHPIPEPSIDFELDVKVFFNSGKCVFHTKDSYKDDDQSRRGTKKERSFSGGFESSSSPSHSSKKRHGSGLKLNASSTKLRYLQSSAAGQIADFTIFLIPGLDVKVHYNSKTVIGESLSLGNKASNLKQHSGADLHVKRDGGSFFGPNLNGSVNSQSAFASSGNHGTEGRQQHVTFFDPPVNTSDLPTPNNKKSGVKKASLFAWMTLQSIPEEAVVSPHILDFLEQALEPIPLQITKPTPTQVPSQTTLQASEVASSGKASTMVGAATSQYAAYASFPVDVIVYFRMQPSIVRFSCLPVSRVECLLRLPSVDLVFSSKRAEDEPFPIEGTPSETPKTPGVKGAPYMRKDSVKPGSEEGVGGLSGVPSSVAGGLSMTGCLADFSLYIFHPYGGAKKPGGSSSGGSSRVGETSPLATSERKDSLSLQVEFVKVNISRSRKMNVSFENPTQHSSSLNQSSSSSSTSSRASQSWSRREYGFGEDIGLTSVSFISVPAAGAVIRFSAVCDIGSASFKYDMRRLTEILAFPKAWYRRSIARRMFLGDQSSTGALYSDQDDSLETSSSSGTLSPSVGKPEFFLSSTPQTASDISSSVHTPGEKPVAHSCPTGPLSAFDQLLLMNTSSQHPSFSTHKSTAEILAQAGESQSTSTSLGSNSSSTGSGSGSSTNSSLEGPRLPDRVYSHPASLPSMGYVGQGGREGLKLHFRDTPTKHGMKEEEKIKGVLYNSDGSPMHVKGGSAWETLVLFAVSLSRLNVQMNMGNVMGNTTWLTRDFKSQGRLSIGSSGHKNLLVSVGLEGSSLDSKGGIVGGAIELSQIDTYIHLREDYGQKPDHKVALKLAALEAKLDYMGTSVLMSRVSSLDINLKDEWQINNILQAAAAKLNAAGQPHHYHYHRRKHQASSTTSDEDSENGFSKHPTKRPALIFIHGILGWDQLQLLISKSTTTDLMKMYTKLEEFFSQQFHSSKRVFSSLQTAKLQHHRSIIRRPLRPKPTEGSAPTNVNPEARHHRHWQKVLALVSGLQMNTLPTSLPAHGTILGGTMELRGNNISLACFHGINFRSKSWAIFSLKEPNIVFSTEAQEIIDKDAAMNTHIVQNLSFGLGQQSLGEQGHHHHQQSNSMATVCKISRNVLFPPQFKTMQEWFHYSFSTSDLDDVNRFPVLEHERESAGGNVPAHDRRASVATSKGPELSHNQEIIFALPSLQFHLKTEHFQTQKTPTLNDPKPTVECSFVTEFDDHIFVSVDAEAFFFLHDLITSYIKEKDSSYSKTQSPDSDRRRKVADPTEALQKDWRDYVCHTWHLEPTVRLQSWAGKGFEPYGVDYILQKLGFSHARVTIPKWTQRGCMDPLDKILSVVMMRMLSAVKEEKDVTTTVSETNP